MVSTTRQTELRVAWRANRPGSSVPHAVVILPSYSFSEAMLAHYDGQLHAYEHRYLLTCLMLARLPACHWVFVSSQEPDPAVLEYYRGLLPERVREEALERMHVVTVPDTGPRPLAAKVLDSDDAIDEILGAVAGRPALIEPWNVGAAETELGDRLGLPVNGTPAALATLAYKGAGRKVLAEAGVPVPLGREGVQTLDDVVAAASWLRRQRPDLAAMVVKQDDSVSGVGNVVLRLQPDGPGRSVEDAVRASWEALPELFRAAMAHGGVVEELLTGDDLASPSVQADITPYGDVVVLSTHEQVLGGPDNQVYEGCAMPACAEYAAVLARHALAVGRLLADRGALGRFGVDFVAARTTNGWDVHGLEINLRRGGTTHPFTVLRSLVPGSYDVEAGQWVSEDGVARCYRSTDHLQDPRWARLSASQVIDAVARAGLQYDPRDRRGVVLHMLSGLPLDGWLGMTALASSDDEAVAMMGGTRAAIDRYAVGG